MDLTTRRWRTATASVALGLLVVLGLGLAGCTDDDGSSPADVRPELEQVVEATEAAGPGTFELVDDLDGNLLTAEGRFTQDPPAFTAVVVEDERAGQDVARESVVVDGIAYSRQDDGPWISSEHQDDALLWAAPAPAEALRRLLQLDLEPQALTGTDALGTPEQAERTYRWHGPASDFGVLADYEDADTVVDVAVDDEQRVVQIQVRVARLSDSLPGGTTTFTLAYEDGPPITAPAESEPLGPVP